MVLLKAGAETDKRDVDGNLAIDLAPDIKVSSNWLFVETSLTFNIADTAVHFAKRRERRNRILLGARSMLCATIICTKVKPQAR